MPLPSVAVVVLNWNGRQDTLDCLASLLRMDYPDLEVVVVDNGSTDGSVQAIRKHFPMVSVVESRTNLGFAAGNNLGIRHALKHDPQYILLLNNDTVVDPQLLNQFVSASKLIRPPGILSAKIYFYSKPTTIWYAGAKWMPDLSCFVHVGFDHIDDGRSFTQISETDYACGCAFFFDASILPKVGLFDEKYFLTFEETDLCYRARRIGYKSFVVPEAKVWHKVSSSFGGAASALFGYFITRNRLLWGERHLPVYERIQLQMRVLREVSPYNVSSTGWYLSGHQPLPRRVRDALKQYASVCKTRLNDPVCRAKRRGVRDYFLRRFGDCPLATRSLIETNYASAHR